MNFSWAGRMGPAQEEKPSLHFPWQLGVRIPHFSTSVPERRYRRKCKRNRCSHTVVESQPQGTHGTWSSWSFLLSYWGGIKTFIENPEQPSQVWGWPFKQWQWDRTFPLNSVSWERRHSLISTVTKKKTPNSHINLSFVSPVCSVEKGRNTCLQAELALEEFSTCSGSKGYSWPGVQSSVC